MEPDGTRLQKKDPRMTLMTGSAYVKKFFSMKPSSSSSLPEKAQIARKSFIDMGFYNGDLVDQVQQTLMIY